MLYLKEQTLEIAFAVLYVCVDINPFIKIYPDISKYRSIELSNVSKHYHTRSKKVVLLLIADNISIEKQLINVPYAAVNLG